MIRRALTQSDPEASKWWESFRFVNMPSRMPVTIYLGRIVFTACEVWIAYQIDAEKLAELVVILLTVNLRVSTAAKFPPIQ